MQLEFDPVKTKNKTIYTEEPTDEGWKFGEGPALDPDQQKALGIPDPAAASKMKGVRKPSRPAHQQTR